MWLNIRRAPATGEHSKSGSKFNLISVNKIQIQKCNMKAIIFMEEIVVFLVFFKRFLKELFSSNALTYFLSVRKNKCLKIC